MNKYAFISTYNVFSLFIIVFTVMLVLFPNTSLVAAVNGIELWLYTVFPAIFPFMTAAIVIDKTNIPMLSGKLFEPFMRPVFNVPGASAIALIMGIVSGYPVGARITASLKKRGLISKTEAERLLCFTNNSSPLFILGAVASGITGRPETGPALLFCHIAASLTVGLIFSYYKRCELPYKTTRQIVNDTDATAATISTKTVAKAAATKVTIAGNAAATKVTTTGNAAATKVTIATIATNKINTSIEPDNNPDTEKSEYKDLNIGRIFGNSVKESIMNMLVIGGFIIFFSVLTGNLQESGVINDKDFVIFGFLEITNGIKRAAMIGDESKYIFISAIAGWAGLSVHSQVAATASEAGISIRPYLAAKLLHGLTAAGYTYLVFNLFRI